MEPLFSSLLHYLKQGEKRIGIQGLEGSSPAYFLSLLKEKLGQPFLVITPTLREAEEFYAEVEFFRGNQREKSLLFFSSLNNHFFEFLNPSPELVAARMEVLYKLITSPPPLIIAPFAALIPKILSPKALKALTLRLSLGKEVDRERLAEGLLELGYQRVSLVEERGEFSVRGGLIDLFPPLYKNPLRIELWGDEIESLREFDPLSQRSREEREEIIILPLKEIFLEKPFSLASFFDYLPPQALIFLDDSSAIEKEGKEFWKEIERGKENLEEFFLSPSQAFLKLDKFPLLLREGLKVYLPEQKTIKFSSYSNEDIRKKWIDFQSEEGALSPLLKKIREWLKAGNSLFLVSPNLKQTERLSKVLEEYGLPIRITLDSFSQRGIEEEKKEICLLVGRLSRGFRFPLAQLIIITEEEIFGEKRKRLPPSKLKEDYFILSFSDLKVDDLMVHVQHGVGIYRGLKRLKIGGITNDYLLLEYRGGDKLYLPIYRLNLLQKYLGIEGYLPRLDKLGGDTWKRTQKKVKESIQAMAKGLLELYATRKVLNGYAFSPPDHYFREFEASFEYEETPDQLAAIEEVLADMEIPKPMDRLVCGDVGYGKTEVALRTAFKAVMDGKQVALLVPTTVLAQQHYQTFYQRLKNYPVYLEVLSRFRSSREQREVIKKAKEGKIDILIGTHRLLQKDVGFKDLGLLIVDEEHRFGVAQKEQIKKLKKLVDVLTLSATPIPRTLHMSLLGIRDLSLINTPPPDRLSIRTYITKFRKEVIREAILQELKRGGQVFFVHNQVRSIPALARFLKNLIPEAKLAVAHGQMEERELEKIMLSFLNKEINLLLTTTIIESGLDFPSANTIIINQADKLGLAQLYQLRGRVGRSKEQAYAYLLIPGESTLAKEAQRRLKSISEATELGSGFRLALHDLEIRGAGTLLGPSQSGEIAAVGLEMYTQLMGKAVKELKGEKIAPEVDPEINLNIPAYVPEDYIEDTNQRLVVYKKLSSLSSLEEVQEIEEELLDRYGKIPEATQNLLEVIRLKVLLKKYLITTLDFSAKEIILTFHPQAENSLDKVLELIHGDPKAFRFSPDLKLRIAFKSKDWKEIFLKIKNLLQ